jgi:hypothetical protein
MTTFDPNMDYTLTSDKTTNDTNSIYETIMDVQNTLEEINQLLLCDWIKWISRHHQISRKQSLSPPDLEETITDSEQTSSMYDTIF